MLKHNLRLIESCFATFAGLLTIPAHNWYASSLVPSESDCSLFSRTPRVGGFRMKLELINVDRQRPSVVLDQFPVIVGLDPGADICLDDSAVGHHQCMIDYGDGCLMVWDLGTRSGTHINGNRVSANAPLLPGDEIAFGKDRFVVQYDNGAAKPAKAAEHDVDRGSAAAMPPHRRRQAAAQA
jgi:pSer/pThr/pTyr-binding forkhead associated (FHA) protein